MPSRVARCATSGTRLLLHDPVEPEPFWNRLEAIRWPEDPIAFDRRLAEVGGPLRVDRPAAACLDVAAARRAGRPRRQARRQRVRGHRRRVAHGRADDVGRSAPAVDGAATGRTWHSSGLPAAERARRRRRPPRPSWSVLARRVRGRCRARAGVVGRDPGARWPTRASPTTSSGVDGEPAAVGAAGDVRRPHLPVVDRHGDLGARPRARPVGHGERRRVDALEAGSEWVHLGVFADNARRHRGCTSGSGSC